MNLSTEIPLTNENLLLDKNAEKIQSLAYIEVICNHIINGVCFAGSLLEILIFIFFLISFKNKVSNICSSYFYLLSIGYLIDLISFFTFTLNTYTETITFVYADNLSQWYITLFIGPWNAALSLNRLTSILWWKRHKIFWSSKCFGAILIGLLAYPFALNGYTFFNLHCRIDVFTNECIEVVTQSVYTTAISNATFALISLAIGILTKMILSNSTLSTAQLLIEKRLLIQSFISSFFFGWYCGFVWCFQYVFPLRDQADYYLLYVFTFLLLNLFYMFFHYSSFILLLIYSPKMRNQIFEFYCFWRRSKSSRKSHVKMISNVHSQQRIFPLRTITHIT